MPDIGSDTVNTFSRSWWLWWAGLQPSWRGNEPTSILCTVPTGAVDWSGTRKGSSNGFFVIILALGWWFLGAKNNNGRNISNCGHALDDVIWVLEQMVGSDEPTGDSEAVKRTRDKGDLGTTVEKWNTIENVFNLNWDTYGQYLAWYGQILDPEEDDDLRLIHDQKAAKIKGFPIEEDFDYIRREYSHIVKLFFDKVMTIDINYAAPTKLVPTVYILDADDDADDDYATSSSESASDSSASAMDIDDPAEVPSIRADLMAAWGGILTKPEYMNHLRSLKGTGIELPGPRPAGVYDETNDVEGENSGVGDEANINSGTEAEVEDQAPKPSDTNPGAENDVEDEDQILEPKEVPKPRGKGQGKKKRRGKKAKRPVVEIESEDNSEDQVVGKGKGKEQDVPRAIAGPFSGLIDKGDVDEGDTDGETDLDLFPHSNDAAGKADNTRDMTVEAVKAADLSFFIRAESGRDIISAYANSAADSNAELSDEHRYNIAYAAVQDHFKDINADYKFTLVECFVDILKMIRNSTAEPDQLLIQGQDLLSRCLGNLLMSAHRTDEGDDNEREHDMHDPPNASGEQAVFYTTPPPSKLPPKVQHINLAEMLKSNKRRAGAQPKLRIASQATTSSMASTIQRSQDMFQETPTLSSRATTPNTDGGNPSIAGFEPGFSQNDISDCGSPDIDLAVEGYVDYQPDDQYESEEPEGPPESPIEEHHDLSEVPLWSALSDGEESAEEDPPSGHVQRKTVTFKDGHDERAYDLMPEVDRLDEDPCPVVVTLKSRGVRLEEPPTEPSTSVTSQESKEKLDEEGLFIDMMNNLVYFGNVKNPNVSEIDEFFILINHTVKTRRSQVRKYLGVLREKFKSLYKQADLSLLQIVEENSVTKLNWEGWSEAGKSGLVELLEIMVKLCMKKASSKVLKG
ncbi:hypothetical protein PILCRDRAFT_15000 [Piloderma croceum F 1598]|uniref:Uncharacterized protein n=1 Tax=Piloderma croceum (strain F 1598) TaxID=765440 RepID=A0A0C3F0N4_PILCF|nr:hypothetical protein PILCRDRAFT_15000 [Piloderma croceum F 1598]